MNGTYSLPPPEAWASDGLHGGGRHMVTVQSTVAGNDSSVLGSGSFDVANDAWKHCKDVSRDDARPPDVYELLSHSVGETQYAFPPKGYWPAQVRMVSPMVNEMPKMVMERYSACQTVAFCGVFPEIKRAWASVDNTLFLWRYDRWQDVPIEYHIGDQPIVAAGIVVPKANVFQAAVQHVLVLCTTTEICFIGVCHEGNDFDEVTLQRLRSTVISVTDNVSMISVASTQDGRVFLGGSDGNVYEIIYAAKDTWRTKRCVKVCHTRGIKAYLPSFIPSSLLGSVQPIVQIVVDDERHILYTRSQSSVIHVFDLGEHGKDAPSKVAETVDFAVDASRALGGREVFGRGAGDKKGGRIVYMAPVSTKSSRRIQLLTVTADGRRVYWSVMSSRSSASRPDRLKAEIARRAVPIPTGGRSYSSMGRSLEVLAACAVSDTLILAESNASEGRTSLFLITRDSTIPPVGTATGALCTVPGLRESVSQLEFPLPGEACVIRDIPRESGKVVGMNHPEYAVSQRFAVATTAGVAEVEMLSPTDTLSQILVEGDKDALEMFFSSYGAVEAAAMCIHLACGSSSSSKSVSGLAEAALDDPRLCGQPEIAPAQQSDEPEWSAAHKGLCLVVSRLLRGVWDDPMFKYSSSAPDLLSCTISLDKLESMCETLRDLAEFLSRYIHRRKSGRSNGLAEYINEAPINKRQKLEDAIRAELKRTEQVKALVSRVADGCFLLMVLSTHNISRLAARMESGARRILRSLRFRDWMSQEEGDMAASQLIAALISEHLTDAGEFSNELAVTLQRGCPSYFKDDDRKYYDARSLLRKAEGANSPVDRENIIKEAVALLMHLAVKKASAVDPSNLALEQDPSVSQPAKAKRLESCYVHLCDLLRVLKDTSGKKAPASLETFEKSLKREEKAARRF
eukprot:jgi/Picre1/31044/NNA_006401.t1